MKLVREALDFDAMAEICMAPQEYFAKYGSEFVRDKGEKNEKFAFYCRDDVSDVLGIAHMDSVQKAKDFGVAKYMSGRELVLSPTLDDRLGCYVICELLPKLGIKTDILLTTDEEIGNSTAKFFNTDKKYKWMYQFDRMGDDVVMYQYDTQELRNKLEKIGFKCSSGSASDISKLGDLGCSGMNFGVGYEDYHYERAYADVDVLCSQVAKFMKFHKQYSGEHLVYDKKVTKAITVHTPHTNIPGPSGGSSAPWGINQETANARRIDGIWYEKMVWDEVLHLYVPNRYLFKNYPATALPTWKKMWDQNERWDKKSGKWVLAEGRYTEDTFFEAIKGVLVEVGISNWTKETVESPQPQAPKASQGPSSNGSSPAASPDQADDPCTCGHSRYVHRRTIWHKGGTPISHEACDFWKCTCAGFLMAELNADIWMGG